MPAKKLPTGTDADLNLTTLARILSSEDEAIAFFERIRWPNGPICPRCGSEESYKITSKPGTKRPARAGLRKCKACRKPFTVRIGTVFEESKIPMRYWLGAMHLMTSSKKGVSSRQIARELGVTVKTAWFITHRVREAMKEGTIAGMLSGAVEADETYVGGKPRYKGTSKPGRGTKKKPVMVLVERDGRAVSKPIDRVDGKTLRGEVKRVVAEDSVIVTDEYSAYAGVGSGFDGGHLTVNHGEKEYVRYEPESGFPVHTNTAESFFALIKRGHYGTFHQLSKRHLHRYCDEFAFRWNLRKVSDGERMTAAIRGAEGKRLRYA